MSVTSTTVLTAPSFPFYTFRFRSLNPKTTSDQSKEDATPPFLRIPYDVRHIIYKMVLQPDFPLRRWEHYMTCPGCNLDITGSSIAKCTNILLVNKQIYDEAGPILHNIEHLVEGLQNPGEGLWRQSSRADNIRVRRSGGVGKLTEVEARPLRKMKFEVTFQDGKTSLGGSWRGDDAWAFMGGGATGWDMGGQVPVSPSAVAEEDTLAEEVKDLARLLREGGSIRKLRIRLKRWPRSYLNKSQAAKIKEEDAATHQWPEVSVQQMVDIFQPLIRFNLENSEEDVEISAEPLSEKEACSQVHEFVVKFNQSRREYLGDNSRSVDRPASGVKRPRTSSEDRAGDLA